MSWMWGRWANERTLRAWNLPPGDFGPGTRARGLRDTPPRPPRPSPPRRAAAFRKDRDTCERRGAGPRRRRPRLRGGGEPGVGGGPRRFLPASPGCFSVFPHPSPPADARGGGSALPPAHAWTGWRDQKAGRRRRGPGKKNGGRRERVSGSGEACAAPLSVSMTASQCRQLPARPGRHLSHVRCG